VRVLLIAAKSIGGRGGRLGLVCPDNSVARVLRIAHIGDVIPTFADEAAARAVLAPG
jgi:anti-anti-sigma regulatory factor